jgi:putative endonuclease
MLDPHLLGQEGERLAADYLSKKGYRILVRNYRYHRNEIDIVARHKKTLCFIEVKTRSSREKGHPVEAVTITKQREIIKAAKAFLAFSGELESDCRFDVVTVLAECEGENLITSFFIEHYIDAFWADY